MHDQYDAKIWVDHHNQFSRSIGGALTKGIGALSSRISAAPAAGQLLAATAALSLTLLTFGAAAA